MTRVFMVTQPKVISFIALLADKDPVFPEAMILGRVAYLMKTGPGWALYRPQPETAVKVTPKETTT
jgi:hypothetical protein